MTEVAELPIEGKPMGQVTDSEAIDAFLDALSKMRRDGLSDEALEEHIHRLGLALPILNRFCKEFREAIDNYVHKHGPIAKDDDHDWAIVDTPKKEVKMIMFAGALAKSVEVGAPGVTLKDKIAQIPLKPSQAERLLGAPLSDEMLRQYEEPRLKGVKNTNPGRLEDATRQLQETQAETEPAKPLIEVDLQPEQEGTDA